MAQGLLHFWCFWLCLKSSLVHSVLWGPKESLIYKHQWEGIHHVHPRPTAGHMADIFQCRNILSVFTIPKLFTSQGLLLPALFSLCLLYLSSNFHGTMIFLIVANARRSFSVVGLLINVLDISSRCYGFLKGFINVIGLTRGWVASTVTGNILSRYAESPWLKIIFLMVANDVTSLIFCLIFLKAEIQDWANERKSTYLWRYKVLTLDETLTPLRPSYLPWNLVCYYLKMKCVLLCQDFYLQNGDNKTYFLELLSVRNSRYRNQSLSSHTINWSCYYNY